MDVLTQRERECLELLAQGLTNAGIASKLGVALPTVAMHLASARRRLGAHTREEAVAILRGTARSEALEHQFNEAEARLAYRNPYVGFDIRTLLHSAMSGECLLLCAEFNEQAPADSASP